MTKILEEIGAESDAGIKTKERGQSVFSLHEDEEDEEGKRKSSFSPRLCFFEQSANAAPPYARNDSVVRPTAFGVLRGIRATAQRHEEIYSVD